MSRIFSRSAWPLILTAVSCTLAAAAIAVLANLPYQLQSWVLPFGHAADIYCFFFLPLWFFAALTGTPFMRGVAWFALGISAAAGAIFYFRYPLPDLQWLAATTFTTASIPVALLYMCARHTPDLHSRLAMARMLVLTLIVLNTFFFLGITSYLTPTIDYRIVFLENLLCLAGYVDGSATADAGNHSGDIIRFVYLFIPVFMMLFLIYLKRIHPASPFFNAYILSIVTGTSLYFFAPAVGPTAVFICSARYEASCSRLGFVILSDREPAA